MRQISNFGSTHCDLVFSNFFLNQLAPSISKFDSSEKKGGGQYQCLIWVRNLAILVKKPHIFALPLFRSDSLIGLKGLVGPKSLVGLKGLVGPKILVGPN